MCENESFCEDEPRGAAQPLDLDSLLDILKDPIRREVLTYLRDIPNQAIGFDDIVDHCAEDHNRARIKLQLRHLHVPKLAAAGVIEYDSENDELLYPGDKAIETWLQYIDDYKE